MALSHKPALYNRWAVLSLEIFGVVFWLVAFSLLADWTAFHNSNGWWFNNDDTYNRWRASSSSGLIGYRKTHKRKYRAGIALAGTAAGLGAVELYVSCQPLSFLHNPG